MFKNSNPLYKRISIKISVAYIICFVLSNVLCVLHVSQIQRILVAISDQFRNCIVKYTRIDESLTYL